MYKLLLCARYLKTRYIALASIISVMLGVATMIVVNSVMAGFSTEMRERIHGILAAGTMAILGFFVIPFKRKQAKDQFKEKMLSLRTKLLAALTKQFNDEQESVIARLKDGVAPYTRYVRTERERIDAAETTLAGLRQRLSALRARVQGVLKK